MLRCVKQAEIIIVILPRVEIVHDILTFYVPVSYFLYHIFMDNFEIVFFLNQ